MTCEEALLLISGHLDQSNSQEEEAQLREHLERCEACAAVLQAFREADAGLLELTEDAPKDLCGGVMDAIRREAAGKKRSRRRWLGLAAALALAVGIGALCLPGLRTEQAAVPVLTKSMADTAAAETALAMEDTTDYNGEAALYAMDRAAAVDPQALAEERQADVAVTHEILPEMEVCSLETLEDGSLLYQLETADGAVQLSRTYGVELYQPAGGSASEVSYALLTP